MPNKKKFTDEQEKLIAQEYTNGANISELVQTYAASSWTINSVLLRHNVIKRKGNYRGRAVQKLRIEEVSDDIRYSFFFDVQYLEKDKKQNVLKISRVCGKCFQGFASIVSQVRADIKRGRQPTAYCRECAMTQGEHQQDFKRGNATGDRKGYKNHHGYWVIYNPSGLTAGAGGYVLEHREVMAQHLNRKLLPGETVHHKNGDRQDNNLNNLELWTTSQPSGQRVEDKLSWAKAFIEEHKNDVL